jgi:cytochrome c-type biogenesis protein CcmH
MFVCFLITGSTLPLYSEADVGRIEESLVCMCETCPSLVLKTCMCGYAENMKKEVQALVDEGKTEDEVIQVFVDRYGERVLALPVQEGFNLTAYVAPFLAILFGGGIIVTLIRRWKGRGGGEPEPVPEVQREVDDDPYRRKLKEELESFKD